MSTKTYEFKEEQLNKFKKEILIQMVLSMGSQISELNAQIAILTEEIRLMRVNQYSRHSEKRDVIPEQMEYCFNDAEVTCIESTKEELKEPTAEEVVEAPSCSEPEKKTRRPHPKGNRTEMLKDVPREEKVCELNEEELRCECGGSFKEFGDGETVTRLEFIPAFFKVITYRVKTYRCDQCGEIRRAPAPAGLFEGSLATESLLSGIMTAKYNNAMPFNRIESSFADNGVTIRRQTMARWMIMAAERYFSLLYDRLVSELLSEKIIHADETTVMVSKDERKAGSKSYMWVYTTEKSEHPVVIFEYQKTRAASHPQEFLADFHGFLCCDGYEGYHSLNSDITVCGCWVMRNGTIPMR